MRSQLIIVFTVASLGQSASAHAGDWTAQVVERTQGGPAAVCNGEQRIVVTKKRDGTFVIDGPTCLVPRAPANSWAPPPPRPPSKTVPRRVYHERYERPHHKGRAGLFDFLFGKHQ